MRLGNLITAFESYSNTRYGIDGVFYWNRIWLKLEKDVRDDIDNHQAMADSTVYASFILFINALLCLV
jgi:flagellar biosynthesis regulator FlaF